MKTKTISLPGRMTNPCEGGGKRGGSDSRWAGDIVRTVQPWVKKRVKTSAYSRYSEYYVLILQPSRQGGVSIKRKRLFRFWV